MNQAQQKYLQDIICRPTAYELAVEGNGQKLLLRYASRKTRQGLLKNVRFHGQRLVDLTGAERVTFGKRASDGATMGAWRIYFTGRTEREAIIEGELPYITAS